jgi:hypothetical protein
MYTTQDVRILSISCSQHICNVTQQFEVSPIRWKLRGERCSRCGKSNSDNLAQAPNGSVESRQQMHQVEGIGLDVTGLDLYTLTDTTLSLRAKDTMYRNKGLRLEWLKALIGTIVNC